MQENSNEKLKNTEFNDTLSKAGFSCKNHKFKFNQDPFFMKFFKLNSENDITNNKHVNFIQIKETFKIGGFKINKMFASFWFGAFLFAMQSYFLRQNLKLTDVNFISD